MQANSWTFKNMKLVLLQILDIHIRKLVSLGPFKKVLISANLEYWQ